MRDLDFEVKVANEEVCGIKPLDVKVAILEAWSNSELMPSVYRVLTDTDVKEDGFFNALADIASYAAQNVLREKNLVNEIAQSKDC